MRISRNCFANFVAGLSHNIRASVVRIILCRELVANWSRTGREVFQHIEKFYANFFSKIFRKDVARQSSDSRATVARRLCECHELVAAKFWQIYSAKFLRHSYECRASVARRSHDSLAKTSQLSGKKIKLSDIRTNVARLSYEFK